jgi:hypothetical protein
MSSVYPELFNALCDVTLRVPPLIDVGLRSISRHLRNLQSLLPVAGPRFNSCHGPIIGFVVAIFCILLLPRVVRVCRVRRGLILLMQTLADLVATELNKVPQNNDAVKKLLSKLSEDLKEAIREEIRRVKRELSRNVCCRQVDKKKLKEKLDSIRENLQVKFEEHGRKSRADGGTNPPRIFSGGTLIQVVPPDVCHFSKFQALAMDSSPPQISTQIYATVEELLKGMVEDLRNGVLKEAATSTLSLSKQMEGEQSPDLDAVLITLKTELQSSLNEDVTRLDGDDKKNISENHPLESSYAAA